MYCFNFNINHCRNFCFAYLAPNDPYENNILNKFAPYSWKYPLGTDHLGRCVFSRMIYEIRPTLFLSLITMMGTIGIGTLMGLLSGYFKGIIDNIIMRVVDINAFFSKPNNDLSSGSFIRGGY